MQYLHMFLCFALVPLASSAVAECLKSNIEGQSAQGQLAIGRARDAAGRPETPYILRLASNACLDADNRDDAVRRARTIHMLSDDKRCDGRPSPSRQNNRTTWQSVYRLHSSSSRPHCDACHRNQCAVSAHAADDR